MGIYDRGILDYLFAHNETQLDELLIHLQGKADFSKQWLHHDIDNLKKKRG